jgi:hypothetical protein
MQVPTMPSQRPRVALTMPDDLNAIFDRLSELQGIPKTKLIIELLDAYKPILNETIKALEKIEADKSNAVQIAKEFGQSVLLDATVALGSISQEVRDL